ncbi:MAG: YdcF family protein [Candidatus Nanopelagicales bacterium]|nr:YdcF family protein [Candidatus Nanopelagicales bacterium]
MNQSDLGMRAGVEGISSPARIFTLVLTVGISLLLLIPIGAAAQIVLTSQIDDRTTTQAIVVMDPAGAWGNQREAKSERLKHAAELYLDGVAPVIMITGPERSYGKAAAELEQLGVEPTDVIFQPTGTDTVGTLAVVATLMSDLGWSAATIVTDPAHSARSQVTAGKYGIDAHMSPAILEGATSLTSEYVARESVALVRHYLYTQWQLPAILSPA